MVMVGLLSWSPSAITWTQRDSARIYREAAVGYLTHATCHRATESPRI